MRDVLGILGGMGPLASAEFVRTLYEHNLSDVEQRSPACVLWSDPSFPDRTAVVLDQREQALAENMEQALQKLESLGATKFVVTCVTSHCVLPLLPPGWSERIVSLVQVALEEIVASRRTALLLCTRGTRAAGLFEGHPLWDSVKSETLLPDESDQDTIQELVYRIKRQGVTSGDLAQVKAMLDRYRVEACVAGCTELHLMTKFPRPGDPAAGSFRVIDPLVAVARDLTRWVDVG